MTKLSLAASNGLSCTEETHEFRLCSDTTSETLFRADSGSFHDALNSAIIDHALAGRPWDSGRLYLQVWCGFSFGFRNVQYPDSGSAVGVTAEIADQPQTSASLFLWACSSVQLARDLALIAAGMSRMALREAAAED